MKNSDLYFLVYQHFNGSPFVPPDGSSLSMHLVFELELDVHTYTKFHRKKQWGCIQNFRYLKIVNFDFENVV